MRKKLITSVFLGMLLIIVVSGFVVGASSLNSVCCEKTLAGAWCQNTEASQCDSSFSAATTSCAQTSFCQLGTCVNTLKGVCSPNTGKTECESKGGSWYKESVKNIPLCKPGCCQIGDEVAFVSQTECKQLSSDYGIEIIFHSSVNDESTCLSMANSKQKGACVSKGAGTSCSVLTKEECLSQSGNYHSGLLCTATELATDCAPSSKTVCNKDDVYFLDSCGNIANIYDESFDPATSSNKKNGAMYNDYWTYIYKESDYIELGSALFGDCNYATGTMCKEERGKNVCVDLSCKAKINGVDTKKNHGESWCAETAGTMHHITVDPETMEWENENQLKELISNYNEYNIPGSRYVRLQCWEGEIIEEPCADFRNEICKEANIGTEDTGEFTIGQCRANTWRQCLDITDKTSCEDPFLDCTWVPGYRFDLQMVNWADREKSQGSCVPLFAPGFDFWEESSSGIETCALGSVTENVLYETHFLSEDRDNLISSLSEATKNCYSNCYAIPGYGGNINFDILQNIHLGLEGFDSGALISNRKGYYCEGKTGAVNVFEFDFSDKISCASTNNQPVYYTNEHWLTNITKRAALLGDCGYKVGVNGEMGENSTEIITSIMEKLKQSGESKSNMTDTRTIYIADEWNSTEDKRTKGLNINKTGVGNKRLY